MYSVAAGRLFERKAPHFRAGLEHWQQGLIVGQLVWDRGPGATQAKEHQNEQTNPKTFDAMSREGSGLLVVIYTTWILASHK